MQAQIQQKLTENMTLKEQNNDVILQMAKIKMELALHKEEREEFQQTIEFLEAKVKVRFEHN